MEVERKPLNEKEIVVHVPKGDKDKVRVVECDSTKANAEIIVQVSKKRKPGVIPVLGVIVK